MNLQKPKGTKDLYGEQIILYNNIIKKLVSVANEFNFKEIKTPIFENEQVFLRTIGQETDILQKEIYQFKDKGGRNLALRPEGTAGVIRAVVENKLYSNKKEILKLFYYGTMYRYERPQKGRSREFHQFGVEAMGAKHFLLDVEVILLAWKMVKSLQINNICLNLNFFGSQKTKQNYEESLVDSLKSQVDKLCNDCQIRLDNNPLRILDCKECSLKELQFLKISSFYSQEEKEYFENILSSLTELEVNYKVDDNLVRGLDYYNGVIFEVTCINEKLGKSQNTIVGGGRYDDLAKQFGLSQDYPSIGFAFGIERLMLLLGDNVDFLKTTKNDLLVINQNKKNNYMLLSLIEKLRNNKLLVETNFDLFSEKQKNNLIKNYNQSNNILVLTSLDSAILYQLTKKEKQNIIFSNQEDLLQAILKYIK